MGIEIDTIHATGGAAVNAEILQVMADVFGAAVYHFPTSNSAALGAALRAWHADALDAGHPLPWEAVTSAVQPDSAGRVVTDPEAHAIYRCLLPLYAACEAHALGRGPDPTGALETMRT
jgi:xylulokinase